VQDLLNVAQKPKRSRPTLETRTKEQDFCGESVKSSHMQTLQMWNLQNLGKKCRKEYIQYDT
jgi:hypothetical protein